MPDVATGPAYFPFGDTFLVIGGYNDDHEYLTTLLELDPDSMEWLVRPERLAEGREGAVGIMVDAEYLGCHE